MIAQPEIPMEFQAAPGTNGARPAGIACDLLPLTEAGCVLASMADALVLSDLSGGITYLNPAAVRLTRWDASDAAEGVGLALPGPQSRA